MNDQGNIAAHSCFGKSVRRPEGWLSSPHLLMKMKEGCAPLFIDEDLIYHEDLNSM